MFDENEVIQLGKGEGYLKTAQALSDVIAALPLDNKQNQRLIESIMEHVDAGRKDAFTQGVCYVLHGIRAATDTDTQGLPC